MGPIYTFAVAQNTHLLNPANTMSAYLRNHWKNSLTYTQIRSIFSDLTEIYTFLEFSVFNWHFSRLVLSTVSKTNTGFKCWQTYLPEIVKLHFWALKGCKKFAEKRFDEKKKYEKDFVNKLRIAADNSVTPPVKRPNLKQTQNLELTAESANS